MQKITPFLMFDNNLGEALKLYASTFSDWKLLSQNQTGDMVMSATFAISGKEILSFNGGPHFKFTPAISFFLSCQTSKEVEKIWASLSQEGIVLMELQEYPFSEKFGWLQDKFGVSWQVHLSKEGNDLAPFLMFVGKQHGKAEEAIRFYTSRFPNSKIKDIQRYAKDQGEKEGTVQRSVFSIAGQDLMAIDSGLDHTFTFSEAYSFFVKCETQAEIDEYWEKLSFQGEKQKCGWVKDQFGVSWQIIPLILGDYLQDKDPKKSQRVLQAMLQMDKIDIAKLKRAYDSN
ncbi:VOC family protein [Leptospira kirschneri]|uniref:3-demethylubiquinone-9 3-methyltransferase domain protein n=2 Tax=Leptospira kirschneri TaxID=29507 RepID=A0A0E2BID8_9LEPT|nr:VOC family protein [Leptospira kirschneri]EKO17041.1 3-demethylubiquinone-9 3-methyltransferase domain protein [Leptospira kirschneri str. H1]EMK22937.1 3-demethylubiquinone-9 3-methyltransferase domain protein [Leptospira kirschneri serovar Bulgarica str. Nikolaevo]UML81680.1 VOC family protein [Leptospira kirschneri]